MTTAQELRSAFERQRAGFAAAPYPTLEERQAALSALRGACAFVTPRIARALVADFGSHDPNIGLL